MRKIGYIASGVLVGSSLLIATSAIAGGFGVREQSTTGLGKAFADSAAGTDLSSMFWNPAAVTSQDGLNSLSSASAIFADTTISPPAGVVGIGTSLDEIGLLAGSYYNYQINQSLYVGMSINAPFGLVTDASNNIWAGAQLNRRSEMLTFNAAPTIGIKANRNLSFALGLQVQYMDVRLEQAAGSQFGPSAVIKGDDIDVGFTAGILYKGDSGTSLGVGYRSSISHKLEGTQHVSGVLPPFNISAALDTPEMITASIRQELTDTIAIMANYEWSNWSRLKQLLVTADATGGVTAAEPFLWRDSWLVSAGAEMKVSDKITARTGLGYEQTPVRTFTRGARLPDSDRVWLSLGGSYKWSEMTTLDIGYSHVFFEDSRVSGFNPLIPNAAVENSANIVSVGARVKW